MSLEATCTCKFGMEGTCDHCRFELAVKPLRERIQKLEAMQAAAQNFCQELMIQRPFDAISMRDFPPLLAMQQSWVR